MFSALAIGMEDTDAMSSFGDANRLERQADEVERALDLLDEAAERLQEAGLEETEFSTEIDEARERLEDDVLTMLPDPFVMRDAADEARGGGSAGRGGDPGGPDHREGIHREMDQDDLG